MSLFSALIKVAVETVKLPVTIAADTICSGLDATEPNSQHGVGHRTKEQLEKIKEASEG